MKCHFSSDGKFLHTASLEAQETRENKIEAKCPIHQNHRTLTLHLFIATYQLSSRKKSRSPPTIIHRVKVLLGKCTAESVSKSPINLTWSHENLYVACSSNQLNVYRICLFKDVAYPDGRVLVPTLPVFLPDSARVRPIRYFPPSGTAHPNRATVIIGSRSPEQEIGTQWIEKDGRSGCAACPEQGQRLLGDISPPIGLFLDEDKDLGGWMESKDVVTIVGDLENGGLNRRIEIEGNDDCFFENFLF